MELIHNTTELLGITDKNIKITFYYKRPECIVGTSKNQLSSIISKKEETLALQFPARVPVFPTFLSLLSGEF